LENTRDAEAVREFADIFKALLVNNDEN